MNKISKYLDELTIIDHHHISASVPASLQLYQKKYIDQWFDAILIVDHRDFNAVNEIKNALLNLGEKEQVALWQLNDVLKNPLQRLMDDQYSGDKINGLLRDLQQKMACLKPPSKKSTSLKAMFLLLFSWKQTAWQLWLENYHELKKNIKISSQILADEKAQLNRYSQMFMGKKHELNQQLTRLENAYDLISLMISELQKRIDKNDNLDDDIIKVTESEFIPILQKRVVNLQQQLLIGRQTIMTIDVITQQNHAQTTNIDQALNTTSSALDITAGLVLAEQGRQTIDKQGKNVTKNTRELKAVQQRIEQALLQMDGARKAYKETLNNIEK